jgi:hypothetical protein
MALQFEARKVAMKQDRTGFVLTICIHPDDLPEELIRDFVGARYGCALVRINDDETPVPYNNRVKKAGMICKDKSFQKFMSSEIAGSPINEDQAATYLCEHCGIESRSELNGNVTAQVLFDELILDYESWNKNDPF